MKKWYVICNVRVCILVGFSSGWINFIICFVVKLVEMEDVSFIDVILDFL